MPMSRRRERRIARLSPEMQHVLENFRSVNARSEETVKIMTKAAKSYCESAKERRNAKGEHMRVLERMLEAQEDEQGEMRKMGAEAGIDL